MNQVEKDKLERYGKLICDFANSKTTDDILTSLFENLQSAFNFSRDFKKKALCLYPTKQMLIGKLSEKDMAIFKLLIQRAGMLSEMNDLLYDQVFAIEGYNAVMQVLSVNEIDGYEFDFKLNQDSPTRSMKVIPIQKIEEYLDAKKDFPDDFKDELKTDVKELIEICDSIETMKSGLKIPYAELEKITEVYNQLIPITHGLVAKTQKELKSFILQFIKSEHGYKSKYFDNCLSIYNKIPKSEYAIHNCKLIEINPLKEDYFLNNPSFSPSFYTDAHLFDTIISYCLIEYLKNPDYCGRERMAVCTICDCIFSKSRLNGKQKYCPVCSRKNKMTPEERAEYQKAYRANPARKKTIVKKKREERIRHLMAEAGKTRKQAETIIDNEM